MKQLTCEMCGSNDLIKQDGVFVCQSCGCKYSVEEAKKMMVEVTGTVEMKQSEFEIVAGELIKYSGEKTEVTIPDTVKTIGKEAFANCEGLESIAIPDTVKKIKERAFANCSSLKNISIPDSVEELEDAVFSSCKGLISITFGNHVKRIGSGTFTFCTGLSTIVLPPSLEIIPLRTFAFCSSLTSIDIPLGCREIHNGAFEYCKKLRDIKLPESLTVIKDGAFSSCESLTCLTLPSSLSTIEAKYKVSETQTQILSTFSCFDHCTSLREVTFLGKNTKIKGECLFENCSDGIVVNADENWKNLNKDKFTNKKSSGGCYIATCVYGSYNCPEVWTLRRYRDDTLGSTWYGRTFIRFYYAISPTLVKLFGKTNWFKRLWQGKLDRMVRKLNENGVENTPYQDKEW